MTGALALLEEAAVDGGSADEHAERLWAMGRIRYEGEDTRVALELFRQANEHASEDRLRARILADLSVAEGVRASYRTAAKTAQGAVALAERLGDEVTLARALGQLGINLFFCGEGVPHEILERAVALERKLGGLDLDYGPTMMYALTLYHAGEFERARELLEQLCDRGRQAHDGAVTVPIVRLAQMEIATGNFRRAAALAREAYDLAVQFGREAAEAKPMFTLAKAEAALGDLDSARSRTTAALAITRSRGWQSRGPYSVLAFIELSLENYQAAYEACSYCIDRNTELAAGEPYSEIFGAVEALAALGRLQEARSLLGPWEERSRALGRRWAVAAAAHARGTILAADGDLEGAEEVLLEAVSVGETAGMPLRLGRSLLTLGSVQRRLRKKQAAGETLDEAMEIFERLGAGVWAERARRELGRIGGRIAARAELSATETEIAELVGAGRSNREVAEALHLSPKTVEWNLSKIYRKLGVRSRTELAAHSAERR
jgi:DNA-binding CsgD family transcriptional regulator